MALQNKSLTSEELAQSFKLYPSIRSLDASRNFVEMLPSNSPVTLVTLDLSFNQLSSLNGFDVLKNLKHLNLSNNNISSAVGLTNLESLVSADFSYNLIRVIEGLERQKKLEVANFSHNQLRSYNDVRALSLNVGLKVRARARAKQGRDRSVLLAPPSSLL